MRAVLLDWDGVMVDSTAMYFHLYQVICERYNRVLPISTIEEFRDWYNPQWENNYFAMGFTPQDLPEIIAFTSGYVNYSPIAVYPGIRELLEQLAKQYPIALVSTTKRETILKKLQQEGLDSYITHITGNDGKSEKISRIADTLKLLRCDTGVMVGDTPLDVSSGQANNLPTIGVTYGWTSPKRIQNAQPTLVVDSSLELQGAIQRLISA